MSITLQEFGEKIGMKVPELQRKIAELGFKVKKGQIDDELAELLQDELKQELDKAKLYEEAFEQERQKEIIKSQRKKTAGKDTAKIKKKKIGRAAKDSGARVLPDGTLEIPDIISVKEFSEKTDIPPIKIIGELMKNGIVANINYMIDFETAQILASDFNLKLKRRRGEVAVEDLMEGNLETLIKDDEEDLVTRAPIVTVMGHVDHGKSKLIEYIREKEMLSKEAGGITQHIGAYQVEKDGKKITFLDTPGHEAFTAMRARGAKVTDIAILVVAADDGVMPQTIEAINHAKDAKVPIIVAINKIDKEEANVDRVKTQLAERGLQPEDWSGDVPMVKVSALTGEGVQNLLETILVVAEIANLRANPNREAIGTVIEAHLDKNLGPVATIVINTGTLRQGNIVNIGTSYGKVKAMKDHAGKNLKEAGPSVPVRIAGLSSVPKPGDILQVFHSEQEAREKAVGIGYVRKTLSLKKAYTMENLLAQIQAGKLKTLKVVLKTDTNGSLEAIKEALSKIKHEEVSVKIIHSGVGAITESDIMMAKASEGVTVGFHVAVDLRVSKIAEREGVQILMYTVIYKLIEELKDLLAGLLEPEVITVELGKTEIKKIFMTGKKEMIVGCKVTDGVIEAKARLRVRRGKEIIGEGIINSLRSGDKNASQIGEGHECGVRFEGPVKLEEGDILEAYKQEFKKRTLSSAA